jgi:DNA replication protein DnaC
MKQNALLKNTISTSNNRCTSCSRKLLIQDNQEYCFYCEQISKEDDVIQKEMSDWLKQRQAEKKMEAFKKDSIINPKLMKSTLSNFNPENESQQKALQISVNFVRTFDINESRNLIFIGSPGLGKSHLSAAISKAIVQKGHTSIFISVPKLMTKIKNTYNKDSEYSEADVLKALETVDLLVLDDVGAEKTKEDNGLSWAKTKMFEIVDSRIGKHTIYTTNYTGEELIRIYGERDFSRMVERTRSIKMDGKNFRFKNF